jgi:hypothetical protein
MKKITKRDLAVSLHMAGRPLEEIAQALTVPVMYVEIWINQFENGQKITENDYRSLDTIGEKW